VQIPTGDGNSPLEPFTSLAASNVDRDVKSLNQTALQTASFYRRRRRRRYSCRRFQSTCRRRTRATSVRDPPPRPDPGHTPPRPSDRPSPRSTWLQERSAGPRACTRSLRTKTTRRTCRVCTTGNFRHVSFTRIHYTDCQTGPWLVRRMHSSIGHTATKTCTNREGRLEINES